MQRVDLGVVPYAQAVADMSHWVAERRAGTAPDRLFLLTHPPVITYGRRTDPADLPAATATIPTVEVDRGGYATYHGPGQLVGGVTSHGFALNVAPDMRLFQEFTACGMHDVTMVSLRELADERGIPLPSDAAVRDAVAAALGATPEFRAREDES